VENLNFWCRIRKN